MRRTIQPLVPRFINPLSYPRRTHPVRARTRQRLRPPLRGGDTVRFPSLEGRGVGVISLAYL
jgi:hypothetical protein